MPSQRPFFLSTFFAAFRQQPASALQQANKSTATSSSTAYPSAASNPRSITTASGAQQPSTSAAAAAAAAAATTTSPPRTGGPGSIAGQRPLHSPRGHAAIPIPAPGRRRGSNSSSEGYREVVGADKWYIGGRTAAGEEKFFKLGVVRRVRSGDRLSLDRLSL